MTSAKDVANRWADHNEHGPRKGYRDHLTAGSYRFEGPMIYSYRTQIARYWGGFVLIDDGKWKHTTARHISLARNAASLPVFMVPDINRRDDAKNVAALTKVFDDALADYRRKYLQTSENWHFDYMRQNLLDAFSQAREYLTLTKCPGTLPDYTALLAEADEHRAKKFAHYSSPQEVEKRARSAARKEAKRAFDLLEKES